MVVWHISLPLIRFCAATLRLLFPLSWSLLLREKNVQNLGFVLNCSHRESISAALIWTKF